MDAADKNLAEMKASSEEMSAEGDDSKAEGAGANGGEGANTKDDKAVDGNEKASGVDSGQREKFITAQSEYQANMKMFNTMAEATATSLKSIGDAMASLSRKQ